MWRSNIPINKKIEKKPPQKVAWFNKEERSRYLASLSLEELGGVVKYLQEELTRVEQRNYNEVPSPPYLLAANAKMEAEKCTITSDSVMSGLKGLSINESSSQATEPVATEPELDISDSLMS